MNWLIDNISPVLLIAAAVGLAACIVWMHAAYLADKRAFERPFCSRCGRLIIGDRCRECESEAKEIHKERA